MVKCIKVETKKINETKNKSLITYSLGPPIKVSLVAVILGDDGKEYNCSPSPVKIDCA